MSLETARAYLNQYAPDLDVFEFETSTATVALAAEALGVEHGQIAKTLSLSVGESVIVLVTRGDARLDNKKYKDQFGVKARMLDFDSVEAVTGHPVGGVCPFGLPGTVAVYLDVSLQDFEVVFPAAGSPSSAVRLSPDRLADVVASEWVDVSKIRR